ncbi:MAG: hypothetical protein MJA30_16835, partial [Cytophagales bacterium]|nr:hypothetical protein [Cytophagales bacterium]
CWWTLPSKVAAFSIPAIAPGTGTLSEAPPAARRSFWWALPTGARRAEAKLSNAKNLPEGKSASQKLKDQLTLDLPVVLSVLRSQYSMPGNLRKRDRSCSADTPCEAAGTMWAD